MAITSLITDPSGYPCVNDSIWHIANSDNKNLTNFKFVFDLHDTDGTQYSRTKVFPDPNTERGYFDSGAIIRNTIRIDWFTPSNNFITSTPDFSGQIGKIYNLRVGEEYSSGGVIVTDLNIIDVDITGYNHFPDLWNNKPGEDISQRFNDYMTNRPRNIKVPFGTRVIMLPFHTTGGITGDVFIYQNDYSKKNVAWPNPDIDFTIAKTGSGFYQLNIGIDALQAYNDNDANFFSAGFYEIVLNNKKFTVYFDCQPQHEPVVLYFINAYGMFDTAVFNAVNKLNMKVNRKSYNQDGIRYKTGSVDNYSKDNASGAKTYYETKINYVQNVDWNYKLMMQAPTDDEYKWLAELIFSPLIYMEYQNNFYPVTITNTNYEYSKQVYNKIKNLEIEIELNKTRRGISR